MYVVEELYGGLCKTHVWLSAPATQAIADYRRKEKHQGAFLKKLHFWAQAGFKEFEGGEGYPVRHEGNGVYRVGQRGNLFRLIGFYEDGSRRSFIGIDAFTKHGQKLRPNERARIDAVATVKRSGLWRKKQSNGQYPRLANYQ